MRCWLQALVSYIPSSYGGKEDAGLMNTQLYPLRVLGNAAGVDDEVRIWVPADMPLCMYRAILDGTGILHCWEQGAHLLPLFAKLCCRMAACVIVLQRKQQLQAQLAQVQQKLAQLDQQVAAKAQQEGPLNQQVEDLHQAKQQLAAEVKAWNLK
jgi:DNA-binding transcriptional MerR regulator